MKRKSMINWKRKRNLVSLMFQSCVRGELDAILPLQWEEGSVAVGVVICSKGYPGPFQKGHSITGN